MSAIRDYGMFNGDGRVVAQPMNALPGTRPMPVTRAEARRLIDHFMERRISNHSAIGATTWVLTTYLLYTGTAFQLNWWPGTAYTFSLDV